MDLSLDLTTYAGRAQIGRWLLAILITLSVLLVGSMHPVSLGCMLLLSVGCSFLLSYNSPPLEPRSGAKLLLLVCAVLTAFSLVQAVPLPIAMIRALSPHTAQVWDEALRPLHEPGPAWATLSLDPVATRFEIARGLLYANVLYAGLIVARRSEGTLFLERTLLVSACVLAAAALIHPATGAERVFGLYAPENIFSRRMGPLLNANHLGAYITLGICIATGMFFASRPAFPKLIVAACLVLLIGAQVFTASRGAVGTSLLGVACIVVIAQRRRFSKESTGMLVVLLSVLAGVVAVVLAHSESSGKELASRDVSKFDVFRQALGLCRTYPWFGAGRGAFESTFPKERLSGGNYVYTHPENVLVQWTTEWGIPVALIALITIAWALRPRTMSERSHIPAGAYAALLAVAVHNLVDFSSEVPGVVVALCLCAAMVTGGARKDRSERLTVVNRLALASASILAAVVTLMSHEHELSEEQRTLRTLASDGTTPSGAFYTHIRETMKRHPASPYIPFLGAYYATLHGDQSAIPWVSRALDRSATYTVVDAAGVARQVPNYGRAHLLLGRALARVSPSQARLEYRFALEQDESTFTSLRDEVAHLVTSYEDARELFPQSTPEERLDRADASGLRNNIAERREELASALAAQMGDRLPATAVRLDQDLLKQHPNIRSALARMSARALADIRNKAPWCDTLVCEGEALAAAEAFRNAEPGKCDGYLQVAHVQDASGSTEKAIETLKGSLQAVENPSDCLRALADFAQQAKDRNNLNYALEHLVSHPCATQEECIGNIMYAAHLEEQRKNPRRTLTLVRKALDMNPRRVDLLTERARLSTQLGLHSEASETFETLMTLDPENATQWTKSRDESRQAERQRLIKLPAGAPTDLLPR